MPVPEVAVNEQTKSTDHGSIASPYLTAAEAAAYLRTTVQGIYSLVKRGRLFPMPGSPGRLLFTRESLDKCLRVRRRRK
jgi:excisionase family DNA binding protein